MSHSETLLPSPSCAVLRTLTAHGSYTRQLIMTSDHGTLGLDWWCSSDKGTWAAPDAPIVLFIHGINGEAAAAVTHVCPAMHEDFIPPCWC